MHYQFFDSRVTIHPVTEITWLINCHPICLVYNAFYSLKKHYLQIEFVQYFVQIDNLLYRTSQNNFKISMA